MSRWIDADAMKEKIDSIWNGRPLSLLGARILVMIDEAPSIDIVCCKECKHRRKKDGLAYCSRIGYGYGRKSDDFCSYGERKDEPQSEENEIPEYEPWRDAFDGMDCCSMEVQNDNGNDVD